MLTHFLISMKFLKLLHHEILKTKAFCSSGDLKLQVPPFRGQRGYKVKQGYKTNQGHRAKQVHG